MYKHPAKIRRVRTGGVYVYVPAGMDRWDPKTRTETGQRVRIVQPYGAPRNGTMGHTYVESLTGEFLGLVLCNSLQPQKSTRALDVRAQSAFVAWVRGYERGGHPALSAEDMADIYYTIRGNMAREKAWR